MSGTSSDNNDSVSEISDIEIDADAIDITQLFSFMNLPMESTDQNKESGNLKSSVNIDEVKKLSESLIPEVVEILEEGLSFEEFDKCVTNKVEQLMEKKLDFDGTELNELIAHQLWMRNMFANLEESLDEIKSELNDHEKANNEATKPKGLKGAKDSKKFGNYAQKKTRTVSTQVSSNDFPTSAPMRSTGSSSNL